MLSEDLEFDKLFPKELQVHSSTHWVPLNIAQFVGKYFFKQKVQSVLDIGSGIGKFCLVASHTSKTQYTGVEIRKNLLNTANRVKINLGLTNVSFIHENILNHSFSPYDGFFYYNPFCEQLATDKLIDDSLERSEQLLRNYDDYVYMELSKCQPGRILVTFRSPEFLAPENFKIKAIIEDKELVIYHSN